MPATRTYKTPGVYVAELTSFPPSVVGVETAIPVFIGYTETAGTNNKLIAKPVRIGSLAAYVEVFGGPFKPTYRIADVPEPTADNYDFTVVDTDTGKLKYYTLNPENPTFNLYNSMRLFYDNGGATCYVVSAGLYLNDDLSVNSVTEEALQPALAAAGEQVGPTMVLIPDALLLPPDDTVRPWISTTYGNVVQAMLAQCLTLQDRVAVLDVYGTQYLSQPASEGAEKPSLTDVIDRFRGDVGSTGLSYGMAYFPFVNTTVVPAAVDYTFIDNTPAGVDGSGPLQQLLTWQNQRLYGDPANPTDPTPRQTAVQVDIDAIGTEVPSVASLNDDLKANLPLMGELEALVVAKESVLPASPALAGVMTRTDATRGVWSAPANVSLTSVIKPTVLLNSDQQQDLNVPVNGKAVDALREFPGRGTVVWGARTLDGNSNDVRYIQVRRTLIYLEQSIKNALNPFVFAPNTGQTWATAVSMVSGFLQTVWSQGGLMGATASEAFSVECGLGSTMTGTDVLNGYMIVQVTLQLIRPAEFIELTFKQKMEGV